jgi:hypothetical protein
VIESGGESLLAKKLMEEDVVDIDKWVMLSHSFVVQHILVTLREEEQPRECLANNTTSYGTVYIKKENENENND